MLYMKHSCAMYYNHSLVTLILEFFYLVANASAAISAAALASPASSEELEPSADASGIPVPSSLDMSSKEYSLTWT